MSNDDEKTVPLDPVMADAPPSPAAPPTTSWTLTATTRSYPPRTRWAAIIWGLIIAGIAATTLAIIGSPERRLALSEWAATLTWGEVWVLSALVLGVFILVLAVLALIRRAQRRRREA
jgi:TRAP-type C4-dicarboxylate transport system permease small subunit